MRQRHLQEGHSDDPQQSTLDAHDLEVDSVEPLLHYLVAKDQVEDVSRVLSTLSKPMDSKTRDFELLASFAASPAMIKVLRKNAPDISQSHGKDCIVQSARGGNTRTMECNLAEIPTVFTLPVLREIVSSGWLEGTKLWCKAARDQIYRQSKPPRKARYDRDAGSERSISYLFGHQIVMNEAAKSLAGEEAMLYLWRESGLLSHISDIPDWASRALRHVAKRNSVTLAAELLNRGADVNFQPQGYARSPLHCAATNNSVEGAEMMRFLLLKGADPEAYLLVLAAGEKPRMSGERWGEKTERKEIRDEKGAQNLHKWLGKTWDELVEETKHIRNEVQVRSSLGSETTEE